MIKEEAIRDARQNVSIIDVFQDLYPDYSLKKSGNDYICLCPFHDDHSPSLRVSPRKTGFTVMSAIQIWISSPW